MDLRHQLGRRFNLLDKSIELFTYRSVCRERQFVTSQRWSTFMSEPMKHIMVEVGVLKITSFPIFSILRKTTRKIIKNSRGCSLLIRVKRSKWIFPSFRTRDYMEPIAMSVLRAKPQEQVRRPFL